MAVTDILDSPWVYAAWQWPFVEAKVRPFRRHGPRDYRGRVLDIGCGPGTNAALFRGADYVGVDLNPQYIEAARRRGAGRFLVQDARTLSDLEGESFGMVFANSLMHHLSDEDVGAMLGRIRTLLEPGGTCHILDLVLPEAPSVARFLARNDRGHYARSASHWVDLFSRHFTPIVVEPYAVRALGVPCWQMIYFQGELPRG